MGALQLHARSACYIVDSLAGRSNLVRDSTTGLWPEPEASLQS